MLVTELKPTALVYSRPQGVGTSTLRRHPTGRHREVRVPAVNGFDDRCGGFARRISEQCRQALRNGADVLARDGLCMADVVHVTYVVRDADTFPACFPLLRHAFGEARPAATLHLVGGFDRPEIQIELELLARTSG